MLKRFIDHKSVLISWFLLLGSSTVQAGQLVLIQGYLGGPSSWSDSGIAQQLDANGWQYAGEFVYGSQGAMLLVPRLRVPRPDSPDKFYRVSLPTESSIQTQGYYLISYLKKLRQYYPTEDIILAGHSAGGIVARYAMVQQPDLNIKTLITIASPNLGTGSAILGKIVGDSPLAFIAPMVGANTINRSQGLYSDLLPEMPHRFLYWLNRQPHPKAEYFSIVRDDHSPSGGDYVVAENSQYLEHVYSLRNRAKSFLVEGNHSLSYADGDLLLQLLKSGRIQNGGNRVVMPGHVTSL